MTINFLVKTADGVIRDSHLTPFTFPAGEVHLLGTDKIGFLDDVVCHIADLRGADSHDLLLLQMWAGYLRFEADNGREVPVVVLLPYLPGARADKGSWKGVEVYTRLLQTVNADQLIALDPHSTQWEKFYTSKGNAFTEIPFEDILRQAITSGSNHSYAGVIAPDVGAIGRATRAGKALGVPVYRADKRRDYEKMTVTESEVLDEIPAAGRLLIVDDMCDSGSTVVRLADVLGVGMERLDLWVTHGIFSKGVDDIQKRFGHVFTTDSHPGVHKLPAVPFVHVTSVLPHLLAAIAV